MKTIGHLCIITDTHVQKKYSHEDITRMAVRAGADMIQFRDKMMSTSEMIKTAFKIKKICNKSNTMFIINDRVDLALIVDADGVHLGNDDITVEDARRLLGRDKIIGSTAHNPGEALNSETIGADYIGFGHIFETGSKLKTTSPKGLNNLRKVVSSIKIPILAIGGIRLENISSVMDTGVYGIAVIGAVVKSEDPFETIKKLKGIVYAKKN